MVEVRKTVAERSCWAPFIAHPTPGFYTYMVHQTRGRCYFVIPVHFVLGHVTACYATFSINVFVGFIIIPGTGT